MRKSPFALVAVAALATAAHGQSAISSDHARQLVAASAEAIGGLDRLRAVSAVRVVEQGHEYLIRVGDPRLPHGMMIESVTSLRRMNPPALRRTMQIQTVMNSSPFSQTIVASDSVVSTGSVFDRETSDEELTLSPERVLLTALGSADLHALPDSAINGIRHHIVEFRWVDGIVRLALNANDGFPGYLSMSRDYPTNRFWAMFGDIHLDTHWTNWSLDSTGLWYPRGRTITANGERMQEYVATAIDLAAAAPSDSFAITDSARAAFAAAARAPRAASEPTLTPVTIADGIVRFQGFYQGALVREPNGVIVLEAPESNAKSRAVLAQAARLFPGLPVIAVISTCSAWTQYGGLREYVSRGIPIYVLDVNAARVRALLAAPFHSYPDSLARAPRRAILRLVSDSLTIGVGANRMKLIPAPTAHGSGMMLVYWPEHHLLYASDVLLPPMFEPNYNAAFAEELKRTIARLGSPVDNVFAFHVPLTAWH